VEQNEGEEPKLGTRKDVVNDAPGRVAPRPPPRYVAAMRSTSNNACFCGDAAYARVRGA
jgi:hypothetical protein